MDASVLTWWLGRDNPVALGLFIDGSRASAAALGSITRWVLVLTGSTTLTIDSSAAPAGTFALDADAAKLEVNLSDVTGLVAGRYTARLISYDPAHDDGIVWLDRQAAEIRD